MAVARPRVQAHQPGVGRLVRRLLGHHPLEGGDCGGVLPARLVQRRQLDEQGQVRGAQRLPLAFGPVREAVVVGQQAPAYRSSAARKASGSWRPRAAAVAASKASTSIQSAPVGPSATTSSRRLR